MEKTKEQIELALGKRTGKFLKEQIGEYTGNVNTKINDDTILVRFKGALSPAEKDLMQNSEEAKSIRELKERLFKNIKPQLKGIIKEITNAKVINIHSDVNIETGERILIFTVDKNLEDKLKK